MKFEAVFDASTPVIGMVHLPPLPGAPAAEIGLDGIVERAISDAKRLEAGGVDGILVENFGDAPFYPDDVPKHTVASMTRAAVAICQEVKLPLGINVLRNDAEAALSVAHAGGAEFVRVNVHTGARVTDQGVVEGKAHQTLRLAESLAADIAVFADVDVKHSVPLGSETSAASSFVDLAERGHADAAILSGSGTGQPVETDTLDDLATLRAEHGFDCPLLVGSGVTRETVAEVLVHTDGAIVGTALKEGGRTTNPVDESRVSTFMSAVREARE